MCGILGAINIEFENSSFSTALETIRHRGPDSDGIVTITPRVRMGHVRLSIVDLSDSGRQPFYEVENQLCAVINGEIYNHLDLRSKLEQLGYAFRSSSDSEVILHGYKHWGCEVVKHLSGIFSFAIYDGRCKRMLLVRDATGVKPLYYKCTIDGIMFASELKALLLLNNDSYKIEEEAIWTYLSYRYIPSEMTPFSGIKKIPPAHIMVWENGKGKLERWWHPRLIGCFDSIETKSEQLRSTMQYVVEAQLMSDVPIGLLLSGGIDSSAIAAIASKTGIKLEAFCCGFNDSKYDERKFARLTAKFAKIQLHETVMNEEMLIASIPDFISWFDEPFFDYSAIAVNHLCKMACKMGIKVLLGGDGADEIFAGYLWYDDFVNESSGRTEQVLEKFFSYKGFFTSRMINKIVGRDVNFDHLSLLRYHDRPDLPPVSRGQWLDFHTFLPDDILTKIDRAGMAEGIEVRVPFLDQRILDDHFLLPQDILYANKERKYLLKRSLSNCLPKEILTNRKKGFGFPLNSWSDIIKALAKKILPNGMLIQCNYLCHEGVIFIINELDTHYIWLVLMLEIWFRKYVNDDNIESLIYDFKRSLNVSI